MTKSPPEGPSRKVVPPNPETARIVLRMDHAISAFRAGELSGLEALDSTGRVIDDVTDINMRSSNGGHGNQHRRLSPRPDRVELAVLLALADTYGSEILSNASLGFALRLVARKGGVALVQRVLWGESAADRQLAMMLGATRVAFEEVVNDFSDTLLAQAHNVLASFRPRPPGGPKSGKGERG